MLARRTRGAVAVVAVACLLAGCSGGSGDASSRGQDPGATPGAAQQQPGSDEAVVVQPAGNAAGMARQLNSVVAVLQDEDATAGQVRRAGELQQLVTRALIDANARF